jgi:hypothetical protein
MKTTLSDEAAAILSCLRVIPNTVACENCLAAYLGVDRSAALTSIRELIQAGRILCTYADCAICEERRLVAHVRAEHRQVSSR